MLEFLRSLRPPDARLSRPAAGPDAAHTVVTLAGGLTPQSAVERLLPLISVQEAESLLVLPSVANRPQSGTHPQVVMELLERAGAHAVLGIPAGAGMSIKRRWEHLARQTTTRSIILGSGGWDRVEFTGEPYLLDEAYAPAEVTDATGRIAIPSLGDKALALGFWRELLHPHTRLRTHNTSRERMLAELSTVVHSHYLLDASRLPPALAMSLVAWTDNVVAAELVGLGIRRYIEDDLGHESVGPWEDARVQAAAQIGHGPASGASILLRADPELDGLRVFVVYLADQLGCGIEWLTERSAGE